LYENGVVKNVGGKTGEHLREKLGELGCYSAKTGGGTWVSRGHGPMPLTTALAIRKL